MRHHISELSKYGVTVTPTGLFCRRALTFDEWRTVGSTLWRDLNSYQWALGDWWCSDSHSYGERKSAARSIVGREFKTLVHYGSTARKVESARRRECLSFSHHIEVAKLQPKQQSYWLSVAVEEKLSVKVLRQKISQIGDTLKFTNAEDELVLLERAARIPQSIIPLWENAELATCLRCNPLKLNAALEALEAAEIYYRKAAAYVRGLKSDHLREVA